jgi:hypothetical protein
MVRYIYPLIFLVSGATLFSCATNPVRVNITEASDASLDCWQLEKEIQRAEQFKIDARKNDHFRWQDIILTTGMMSAYNINKAESNAAKRTDHLRTLYQQKQCTQQNVRAPAPSSLPTAMPPTSSPEFYYGTENGASPYDLNPPSPNTPYTVR